ncbi:50S ribosomal protein L19 [Bacteroides eggerthii CAG:109]|nr:50S ribosomal protein L19 [Bacteroides eggerthii CAG:109]
MDLIKIAEEAFATGKQHPSFKAGDTVTVAYRIVEGNKERVQLYRGSICYRQTTPELQSR